MEKRRNQWFKCFNYLLAGVWLLLGVTSCLVDDDTITNGNYESSDARYTIKGRVVNEEKEAVPDIQLIIKGIVRTTSYSEYERTVDTLYSGSRGEFEFKNAIVADDIRYAILLKDIDRQGNKKNYKTDSIPVNMPDPSITLGYLPEGSVIADVEIIIKEKPVENNDE